MTSQVIPSLKLSYNEKEGKWVGSASIEKGTYAVKITDGENTVSTMDSIRIYAGITTVYSAKYENGVINAYVSDQIVPTPDLKLSVTPSDSVASNGRIEASASVTNLENPSYAWYINGEKADSSSETLSYSLDGKQFEENQTIQVTVFVFQDDVIWSTSSNLIVTEAVTLPDQSEITITSTDMTYGKNTELSYTGNFAPDVELQWSVNNVKINGTSYTPDTIGKAVPVTLTATLGGVSENYTATAEINPEFGQIEITPQSWVPQKAILNVTYELKAPENASLSAEITSPSDSISVNVVNGEITLPDNIVGESNVSLILSYNGEAWTIPGITEIIVNRSSATEAPTTLKGTVGGDTADSKFNFIMSVIDSLPNEDPIDFYKTEDGYFSTDRTLEKVSEGYKFHGFRNHTQYTYWGTYTDNITDIIVDDGQNVFSIKIEDDSYFLNGEKIITIPTEAPAVNTNPGFGGNAEERYNLVMSIYNEIMEAVWYGIPDRMEFTDGHATMTGLQTRSYIIWGAAIVDPSSFALSSANVTVKDSVGNIFEITTENGTFYVNGEICEQPKAGEPVAPTERYPGNAREEIGSEEQNIISIAHDVFTGSSIIMPAIMYNIPEGEYSVGNYKITIHDIKTGNAEITVTEDIVDAVITDRDEIVLGNATILKNSYFISSSMSEEYAEVSFIYDGKTYSCTYTCIYGLDSDEIDCTVYDSDNNVVNDDQIQNIANGVVDFISTDSSYAIFSQEIVEKLYNLLLHISDEATIIITELDMPGGPAMPTSMDYIAAFEGYQTTIHTEEGYIEYTLSTPGFHVTTKDSDMKGSLHGPLNVNGADYYIDVQYQQGFKGSIEGGIKVNGVWKAVTV